MIVDGDDDDGDDDDDDDDETCSWDKMIGLKGW